MKRECDSQTFLMGGFIVVTPFFALLLHIQNKTTTTQANGWENLTLRNVINFFDGPIYHYVAQFNSCGGREPNSAISLFFVCPESFTTFKKRHCNTKCFCNLSQYETLFAKHLTNYECHMWSLIFLISLNIDKFKSLETSTSRSDKNDYTLANIFQINLPLFSIHHSV